MIDQSLNGDLERRLINGCWPLVSGHGQQMVSNINYWRCAGINANTYWHYCHWQL